LPPAATVATDNVPLLTDLITPVTLVSFVFFASLSFDVRSKPADADPANAAIPNNAIPTHAYFLMDSSSV
jgi:hypothetical protein